MVTMTRKDLLAVSISMVFAVVGAELILRWLLPLQYRPALRQVPPTLVWPTSPILVSDPEIGWVLSPGTITSHVRETDGRVLFDASYSISHGQRLTSYHPQSGPLIIATGCSFTFGYRLNDEDSWPWLLQERLPEYHVVNVASSGYGTDQALLAAERLASRFPNEVRTVVLGFVNFQIERNRSPQSWLSRTYPFGKPLFGKQGSGIRNKGMARFWSLGSNIDGMVDHSILFSGTMNLLADQVVYRTGWHDDAKRLTVDLFKDFAKRFQARGIRLVVVILAHLNDQVAQSKADREFVIAQMRAAGILTLVADIPRLTDGRPDAGRFLLSDGHPNRQYNLLLSQQLASFLRQYPEGTSTNTGETRH